MEEMTRDWYEAPPIGQTTVLNYHAPRKVGGHKVDL